ncbi:MAG: thiolase family protein [Alphaproteobacteria bacterium]|nr:thiolase family protein [Alphaproteobacteria bacterium]
MNSDPIVIVSAKRSPSGSFMGAFKNISAPDLGGSVIRAALNTAGIESNEVNEVFMGCVLPAGLGQAPARQAMFKAGLDKSTGCTTVNKVCGSGMKSIIMAHDSLRLYGGIMVAGGMESMSNAPYLLTKAREGYRLGHDKILDHMIMDGLQDAYKGTQSMGVFAENTAEKYGFTRDEQDQYAITSGKRTLAAQAAGHFKEEITPIEVIDKKSTVLVFDDESPSKLNFEKLLTLKPAFRENGTVTAGSSSSINDGSAAVTLMRQSEADKRGLKPLALIHAHAGFSREPEWFTIAPTGAINKVLEKAGWQKNDVDLFEINEAFAVVPMAVMKDLDLTHDIVNVNGGACALGHPIGASGARIVVTLIHALKQRKLKRGVAAICIGGGEATALALEII